MALKAENLRCAPKTIGCAATGALRSRPDGGVGGGACQLLDSVRPHRRLASPEVSSRSGSPTRSRRPCSPTAQLLVSELVSNSVRHSGMPEGEDLVLRVHLWADSCRVEVEDRGADGVIAPKNRTCSEVGDGVASGPDTQRALGRRARRRGADLRRPQLPRRTLEHQPVAREERKPIRAATEM